MYKLHARVEMYVGLDRRECVLCRQRPRSLVTDYSVCACACLYVYMNMSICTYRLLYKISNFYQHTMQRETLFKVSHPFSFSIGYLIQRPVCYSV